jgi:hypothetical protein
MLLALQVMLPLFKFTGRHNYSKALFVHFSELQFLWPRDLALTAVAHSCIDSGGGGVGACVCARACARSDLWCVVGQYAPIGSWYEKMMLYVKERKSWSQAGNVLPLPHGFVTTNPAMTSRASVMSTSRAERAEGSARLVGSSLMSRTAARLAAGEPGSEFGSSAGEP